MVRRTAVGLSFSAAHEKLLEGANCYFREIENGNAQ